MRPWPVVGTCSTPRQRLAGRSRQSYSLFGLGPMVHDMMAPADGDGESGVMPDKEPTGPASPIRTVRVVRNGERAVSR